MYSKNIDYLILVIIFLLIPFTFLQAEGMVAYFEGDVFIRRGEDEFFADFGTRLDNGDVIETAFDSTAILELSQGDTLKLKENTIIVLDYFLTETKVSLETGGLFSKVNRLAGRSFSVQTPSTVAGVRGTEFYMSIGPALDRAPDVWLCVNEGVVEVEIPASGDSVFVNEGEGISIFGGTELTDPQFYSWTEDLNWNTNPDAGPIIDRTSPDSGYTDLLDQDYF